MSGILTIDLQNAEAADAAFEKSLADLAASNPRLFADARVKLTQDQLRALARTFFYLGFQAGEPTSNPS